MGFTGKRELGVSVPGFGGSANTTGSLPTSHCSDQTSRVGERDQDERKRVRVLAENVSRFRQSDGWPTQPDVCASIINKIDISSERATRYHLPGNLVHIRRIQRIQRIQHMQHVSGTSHMSHTAYPIIQYNACNLHNTRNGCITEKPVPA